MSRYKVLYARGKNHIAGLAEKVTTGGDSLHYARTACPALTKSCRWATALTTDSLADALAKARKGGGGKGACLKCEQAAEAALAAEVASRPDPEVASAPDPEVVLAAHDAGELVVVRDSHITATVLLTEDDIVTERLRLPARVLAALPTNGAIAVTVRPRVPTDYSQGTVELVTRQFDTLGPVSWPREFAGGQLVYVCLPDTRGQTRRVTVVYDLP